MINRPRSNKIPISIFIFENNGTFSYRAYSPAEYNIDENNAQQNTDSVSQFLTRVYNKIEHNSNGSTNYGKLKEIHTRNIKLKINERDNLCYFSTYQNEHCEYYPIHRESPIFFNQEKAADYENQQPNLTHRCCSHEFV